MTAGAVTDTVSVVEVGANTPAANPTILTGNTLSFTNNDLITGNAVAGIPSGNAFGGNVTFVNAAAGTIWGNVVAGATATSICRTRVWSRKPPAPA